jgi:hypothetical protein
MGSKAERNADKKTIHTGNIIQGFTADGEITVLAP